VLLATKSGFQHCNYSTVGSIGLFEHILIESSLGHTRDSPTLVWVKLGSLALLLGAPLLWHSTYCKVGLTCIWMVEPLHKLYFADGACSFTTSSTSSHGRSGGTPRSTTLMCSTPSIVNWMYGGSTC